MMRVVAIAAALMLAACPGGRDGGAVGPGGGAGSSGPGATPTTPPDAAAGSMPVTKTDAGSSPTFVRGAAVLPRDQLLAWLGAQVRDGQPRLLRLPAVIARGPMGYSNRRVTVGPGPDALAIVVDDSKLGVALADRARAACKTAPSCALWLEGYWRGEQDGALTFEARAVGEPIAAADLAQAAAEVEGDGPGGN